MYPLQLHELVEVSNNSRVTQAVLEDLNQKLSPAEKELFREWLRIIKLQKR